MGQVGTKQGIQAARAARTLTDAPQYVATAPTPRWPIAAKTGRTLPPPPPLAALQTRSGVAPKAPPLLPKTGSVRPSATPTSQPASADALRGKLDNAKRSTLRPPRLPREADALPMVPQWEPHTTPLKPADGSGKQFWLRLAGTGFAAGFFLGAGYLGALAQQPQAASMLDFGVQHERAPRSLALPLMAAMPKMAAPILTSTAPKPPPMAAESPAVTLATAIAAAAPLAGEAPKADNDASAAKLSAKAAKKMRSTRALHSKTKTAAVAATVAQAEEEEADDSSDTEADEPEAPLARTVPAANLPEQLTRVDVQQGLESARPGLASCAAGQHGTMYANVTIAGTGHVSYSTVEGAFAGTPAGSCMARALRSSDFPKFSGEPLKVRYPFVF